MTDIWVRMVAKNDEARHIGVKNQQIGRAMWSMANMGIIFLFVLGCFGG